MKREILFRGKRVDNGEWIYGGYFKHTPDENGLQHLIFDFIDGAIEVHENTISQLTGLTDKNGVKIFENDILKENRLNGVECYYKVFYKKGGLVINTHQDDFNKPTEHILFYESVADMQNSGFIETLEVIGNIHDA